MKPFQEFRFWLRRSPASERVAAAVGTLLVTGLLGWLLMPSEDTELASAVGDEAAQASTAGTSAGSGSTIPVSGAAAAMPGPGDPATSGSAGSVSGTATQTGTPTRSGATGGSAACTPPAGSPKGVTSTEVKVAIARVSISGPAANGLFGLPTPDEQTAMYEAAIAGVNGSGGVACRDLVASYYDVNPADEQGMHAKCRDMVASGVFAVLDSGSYSQAPAAIACFGQNKVPYFGASFLSARDTDEWYPYLFPFYTRESLYRNTAFGLRDRGFFSPGNGFRRLGFIYRSCFKDAIDAFSTALHQAGVSEDELVTYDVGCGQAFANPGDLQQAVLQFRQAGVTHVTWADFIGDAQAFTNLAEQQGFRPKYGLPDDNLLAIAYGNTRPNSDNIAGAIAITPKRNGEERTPGSTPSPETVRCNGYMAAKGRAPVWEQSTMAGQACNHIWMFQAAVNHAPRLEGASLAAGLQAVGSMDFSYPQGPNDFRGPRTTAGGRFWRTLQFVRSCECWQVVDPTFRPAFR